MDQTLSYRRQGRRVICAIKSNRRMDQQRIDHYSVQGHLEEIGGKVCAMISRRRPRDKYPMFLACTDLYPSVQQALRDDQQRWPVEVDNFSLKAALGLGDFLLQRFEAVERWFAGVTPAIDWQAG